MNQTLAKRPAVTVAAVAERDGRFLVVEEHDSAGRLVINQPAGHLEPGEDILSAVMREALEETGWTFRRSFCWASTCGNTRRKPTAICAWLSAAKPWSTTPPAPWTTASSTPVLTPDELAARGPQLRSPWCCNACTTTWPAGAIPWN